MAPTKGGGCQAWTAVGLRPWYPQINRGQKTIYKCRRCTN